jgi:hypothetical protein
MKAAQLSVVQQLRHQVAFGRAGGVAQLEVDQQTMAILHQRVTQVRQLGLEATSFLGQACFWVGRTLVRRVGALLAAEVVPVAMSK